MSSEITHTSKSNDSVSIAAEVLTLGFASNPNTYEFTDTETGEVTKIDAHGVDQARDIARERGINIE